MRNREKRRLRKLARAIYLEVMMDEDEFLAWIKLHGKQVVNEFDPSGIMRLWDGYTKAIIMIDQKVFGRGVYVHPNSIAVDRAYRLLFCKGYARKILMMIRGLRCLFEITKPYDDHTALSALETKYTNELELHALKSSGKDISRRKAWLLVRESNRMIARLFDAATCRKYDTYLGRLDRADSQFSAVEQAFDLIDGTFTPTRHFISKIKRYIKGCRSLRPKAYFSTTDSLLGGS